MVRFVDDLDRLEAVLCAIAMGWISQRDEPLPDVRFDTQVGGLGPTFTVRVEPLRSLFTGGGFSIALDASGALLIYSSRFPPGGDLYNFAWRVGGTIGYAVTQRLRIELGGAWMHVSNGQGLGPFNPSYEGAGVTFGWQITL